MSKFLYKKKLSSVLFEEKNQNQKDWSAISGHHQRLSSRYKDIADRSGEMEYSWGRIHPEAWRDKRELVNHWKKRVYSPKDGNTENRDFWLNEVETVHWLGFFSTKPLQDILEEYLSGAAFPQAELSAIGYLPGNSVSPYSVGIKIEGTPVYASSGDLYTEFLSTLTDSHIEYFFDNYERIVKTPNLRVNPEAVLVSKHDALYRARRDRKNSISEVIVSDWDISKVYISTELEAELKDALIKKCNNYNVEYKLFRYTFKS